MGAGYRSHCNGDFATTKLAYTPFRRNVPFLVVRKTVRVAAKLLSSRGANATRDRGFAVDATNPDSSFCSG